MNLFSPPPNAKTAARRSGRTKHSADGLAPPTAQDGPRGAEGAGSTAHETEAVAHDLYIFRC